MLSQDDFIGRIIAHPDVALTVGRYENPSNTYLSLIYQDMKRNGVIITEECIPMCALSFIAGCLAGDIMRRDKDVLAQKARLKSRA